MLTGIVDALPWIILALCLMGVLGIGAAVAIETREVRRDLREIDESLKRDDLQW